MKLAWLLPQAFLIAPFIPLLVKGHRTQRPDPDFAAVDQALESSPPARERVVLSDAEERAVREVYVWLTKYHAVLDPPIRQTRQTLAQIVRRCQV